MQAAATLAHTRAAEAAVPTPAGGWVENRGGPSCRTRFSTRKSGCYIHFLWRRWQWIPRPAPMKLSLSQSLAHSTKSSEKQFGIRPSRSMIRDLRPCLWCRHLISGHLPAQPQSLPVVLCHQGAAGFMFYRMVPESADVCSFKPHTSTTSHILWFAGCTRPNHPDPSVGQDVAATSACGDGPLGRAVHHTAAPAKPHLRQECPERPQALHW